jgi:dihydrofolate reductase
MTAPRVSLIVAVARNGVIGRDGGLPWRLSSDLKRFKRITMGKPVIMGRKTWESLPLKPLPGRLNIVVTRQRDFRAEGAEIVATPEVALAIACRQSPEEVFVIGGGELFHHFLPMADRLYLTEVDIDAEGDATFPGLNTAEWREIEREEGVRTGRDDAGFTFRVLDRPEPTI